MATEREYDDAEGVELEIRKPGASTDALRLLQAGRADMAILDIHDLGLARQAGKRHRRRDGVRAAAARRGARAAGDPLPGRAGGRAGRRERAAVRRGGPALGRRRRRRRPRAGAHDHDRLPGGQGAARPPGRRRDRVLERRGRRAARAAAGHPRVPRRRVRRAALPGARAVRDARDARRRRARRARDDPRAAARLRRGPARPGERGRGDGGGRAGTRPRARSTAQLDAVAPAFTAGAPAFGALRPSTLRAWAAWDLRVRHPRRAARRRAAFDTTLVERTSNP